ncbi:hypothetical protein [Staphylococcus xylosus]
MRYHLEVFPLRVETIQGKEVTGKMSDDFEELMNIIDNYKTDYGLGYRVIITRIGNVGDKDWENEEYYKQKEYNEVVKLDKSIEEFY